MRPPLPLLVVHLLAGQHGLPHIEKVVVHVGWEVDLMAVHEGEALQDAWPQHPVLALRLWRVLVLVLRPPEVLPIQQLLDQLAHLAIVESNDGEVVDKCLVTLIELNKSALHLLCL